MINLSNRPYSAPRLTRITVGDVRAWSMQDDLLHIEISVPAVLQPTETKQKEKDKSTIMRDFIRWLRFYWSFLNAMPPRGR